MRSPTHTEGRTTAIRTIADPDIRALRTVATFGVMPTVLTAAATRRPSGRLMWRE